MKSFKWNMASMFWINAPFSKCLSNIIGLYFWLAAWIKIGNFFVLSKFRLYQKRIPWSDLMERWWRRLCRFSLIFRPPQVDVWFKIIVFRTLMITNPVKWLSLDLVFDKLKCGINKNSFRL
jgi:hypothetical protein